MKSILKELFKTQKNSKELSFEATANFFEKIREDLFLKTFNEEKSIFAEKSVLVVNSKTGMFLNATAIFNPGFLVCFFENFSYAKKFNSTKTPAFSSLKVPFKKNSFNFAIVEPFFDKKQTDISGILNAKSASNVIYSIFKTEHREHLRKNFPEIEILGEVFIKTIIKYEMKEEKYDIIKLI